MYMTTKLSRMVIYLVTFLTIKSCKTLITWSCKATWQKIFYISIIRVPMANKLGRKMISLDVLLPNVLLMSHDPLIMWPCEIRGSLTGWASARKRLSRYQLLVLVLFLFLLLNRIFDGMANFFLHMFYLLLLLTGVNWYSLDTPTNSFAKVLSIVFSGVCGQHPQHVRGAEHAFEDCWES